MKKTGKKGKKQSVLKVSLRPYQEADCSVLAQLFYDTVHQVNRADYTREQLDAWADGRVDLAAWNRSFLDHYTMVAQLGGEIIGFGDMERLFLRQEDGQMLEGGYLDRLYVHKDYQRQGVAAAICDVLESAVCYGPIETHASITARGFFEKRGYRMKKRQFVEWQGVHLENFVMRKEIPK